MTMRLSRAFCLAVFVTGVVRAAGGAGQEPAPPDFSTESDLVVLHATVFDRHGNPIRQLTRDVFQVVEDGTPQTISVFSGEDAPVAVGLVLDNSSSMLTRRAMVMAGVTAFAKSSQPDDQAFTIAFNEHVTRGLPETVAFTSNPMLLQASLAALPAGGQTALHDAVIAGLDQLDTAERQKHVLVVLSDGEDNASEHSEKEMLEQARRSDAIVYAVSNSNEDIGLAGDRGVLKRLAEATGGLAYFPRSEAAVVAAFNEIAQNIRRGYSIGYVPTNGARDGQFRKVKVMVRMRDNHHLSVRSRHGYTAPSASGTR